MVNFTQQADGPSMALIAQALQTFCQTWKNLQGKDLRKIGAELGATYQTCFQRAKHIVQQCVPAILRSMEAQLRQHLLVTQPWFQQRAAEGSVLPAIGSAPAEWWSQCCNFALASEAENYKSALLAMFETLKVHLGEADGEEFLAIATQAREKCAKFAGQHLCCVCADALQSLPAVPAASDLRARMAVVQDCAVKLEEEAGDDVKQWFCSNILSAVFDNIYGRFDTILGEAIGSQPDALDSMLISKNSQKLRATVFEKSRHERCVGGLDDWWGILQFYEGLPVSNLTQIQCGKVKSLTAKLQLVRCYSSTVHGLNLLFHRYPGKNRVEKTALLREQLRQHLRPQAPCFHSFIIWL